MKRPEEKIRHLLVIQDVNGRRTIPLEAGTYSIGRHPSNTIVLNSRLVSRQHAVLLRVSDPETGNFFFRLIDGDLQGKRSANGIKVNDTPCYSHILRHRDLILFGGDVRARYHAISNLSDMGFIKYTEEAQFSSRPVAARDSLPYQASELNVHQAKDLSEVAILRLSSFPELSPNPILEIDQAGRITYLNPAAIQEFPEVQANNPDHPLLKDLLTIAEANPKQLQLREVGLGERHYEQAIQVLPEANLIRSYITNITERKLAQRALQESEERYAIAALGANDGLWDWDLQTNEVYYSERWKQMLGLPANSPPMPETWFSRIHPDDRLHVQLEIEHHLSGLRPHLECEFRIVHEDGSSRWMRVRGLVLRDPEAQPCRMAGSLTDITEYRLIQEQILHDALHDAMTGLPNRILMMDRLGQAMQRSKRRNSYLFAVMFLDLDRFKVLNDSLGHLVGDQLLIGIAQRLVRCLRVEDTIARLGGDEFAILLDEVGSVEYAFQVAERILTELRRPFILEGHEIFTGVSIGIAFNNHQDHLQPEDLLRDADTAMYRAKSLGKDRYEVFSSAMRVEAMALLQLETELRRAVERQEFKVYYQPIVNLAEAQICGFETLIRWQHPERGIISPAEFMEVAEETGLILPMSWWVLETACQQMQQWSGEFSQAQELFISVNLTGEHFAQPDLVSRLDSILVHTGFAPQRLRLEVTETILMENTELAVQALEAIRLRGIQIYMDDFGTGYSSLSYLHRFPIDTLKIDRCFISPLLHPDIQGGGIVQTILTLAKSLHLNVVAEGVETETQCLALQRMGCAYAQGYLFAPPLSTEQVQDILVEKSLIISCLQSHRPRPSSQ